MRIYVKAKAGAKEEKVSKFDGEYFEVWVKEPPVQGKANRAIARALAEHFGVPQNSVSLISGFSSKQKVFEIAE